MSLYNFNVFLILIYLCCRQLSEIRASEALAKEKTRRDYERLRIELDEITKQEKEAKDAAGVVSFVMSQRTAFNQTFYLLELPQHSIDATSEARSSTQGSYESSFGKCVETKHHHLPTC